MDDVVNTLAQELTAAIAAAVEDDPGVESVHRKAYGLGFKLVVTLEATIGFATRIVPGKDRLAAMRVGGSRAFRHAEQEFTANDRRELRSMHIGVDDDTDERKEDEG